MGAEFFSTHTLESVNFYSGVNGYDSTHTTYFDSKYAGFGDNDIPSRQKENVVSVVSASDYCVFFKSVSSGLCSVFTSLVKRNGVDYSQKPFTFLSWDFSKE